MNLRLSAALVAMLCFSSVAGAQEAVLPASTSIPSSFHSGWACLDADGNIQGHVFTLSDGGTSSPQGNAGVVLTSGNTVVAEAMTDADGRFTIKGVEPGVYGLTATSETAFAAHAVQVLPHAPETDGFVVSVYASSMSRGKVDEVLRGLWLPAPTGATPPAFGPLSQPAMPLQQSQRVTMRGGVVTGQLGFSSGYGVPESHVVKVFRGGSLVATAQVARDGSFSFSPESAGVYDLVVGGVGFGSLGFEVVDESGTSVTSTSSDGKSRFVSTAANVLQQGSLMVPVIMPSESGEGEGEVVEEEEILGPPVVGGGFAGPGGFVGGGGGFGGGGGGLGGGLGGAGGLLGAAGLAAGIAALADDDDGFNQNIASPVGP